MALPAAAAGFSDEVVRQLRQQGFSEILVESTLLGRTRIVAKSRNGTREIILNPRTGEILRDLWLARTGSSGAITIVDDSTGKGRGTGDGDDDGSDDGSDDNSDDEDDGDGAED